MIEIKPDKNEIYIEELGEIIARIQFIPSGTDVNGQDLIIVNHTVVYNGQNGRGLGKQLVDKLVDYARNENKLIIPICPYAKKALESNPGYQDVLAK